MLLRFLGYLFSAAAMLFLFGAVAVAGAVWWYGQDLPDDFGQLTDYRPPETSVVLDDDGHVIARFAKEQRAVIEIEKVPDLVKQAFISAEDKNFYSHRGIDPVGITKALVRNLRSFMQGGRMSGASTITQQVVKNLLLNNERSIRRKVREAVLAMRIENELPKDKILEIYLNHIYLGARSYGVAAASRNYFGKDLRQLTVDEAAYLAALPKAPSALHPTRNTEAAVARRNYVLNEMVDNGYLDQAAAKEAKEKPLVTRQTKEERTEDTYEWASAYMVEEVRTQMLAGLAAEAAARGDDKPEAYAERVLYGGGLTIRTTLDDELQEYASHALREGLHRYERRHGYRGPLDNIAEEDGWRKKVLNTFYPRDLGSWTIGRVKALKKDEAVIELETGGKTVSVLLDNVKWAQRRSQGILRGPKVTKIGHVFKKGDIVYVAPEAKKDDAPEDAPTVWGLRQLPEVNGAVIAMEPDTGRVLAMQGGISAQQSVFNRATQADRQIGSAFKPFIYYTALDNGYTPATIVLDAPIVVDQGPGQDLWIPENYDEGTFYGPIPIRIGLEKSINLISVRLALDVGMDKIAETAEKMGIYDDMPEYPAYSLGSGETTVAKMAAAYSMFKNGGKKVVPRFIETIRDRDGEKLPLDAPWIMESAPSEPEQVLDPITAYQTLSLMEGVILRGTATRMQLLGFPVAGKTGTTNDARDAWFVGTSSDFVFGCYVGYDNPKSLGEKASGGALCGPIFDSFMKNAMADRVPRKFDPPPGIELVKIDRHTGLRVPSEVFGKDIIWEAFREGTAPLEYDIATTMPAGGYIPSPDWQQPGVLQPGTGLTGFGQAIPGQPVPGQPFPGQPVPGQQVPSQQSFNQPPGFNQSVPGWAPVGVPQQGQPSPYPGQQPPNPNQPMLQVDPNTGQLIAQPDPALRVQPAPGFGGQPAPQPGQPVTPVVNVPVAPVPPPPISLGNSDQDLQGGRGLY